MLHEIVEYYYNNCTRKGLVLEKLKKEYYIFISGIVIAVIAFMASMLYFSEVLLAFIPCMVFFSIFLFCLVFWFNNRAKKFVKCKYGFDTPKNAWGGEEFTEYMDRELINYLESRNLYTDEIMEELICESIQFSEKTRYKSFWEKGFFVAAILPIWIKLIDLIFKDMTNHNEILFSVFMLSFLVVLVAVVYSYIKFFFNEITDSVLNKTSKKYISFADHIKDLKFKKRLIHNLAIEEI